MVVIDGVDMLDVREAATLVGRTPETVRRWVWSGRLDAVKVGNKLMVPRAQVLARGRPTARGDVAEAPASEPGGSLSAWAREVQRTMTSGTRNRSARDLVLADREARA